MAATAYPRTALMIGNFVIGVGILAPAAMINDLAAGLGATVAETGLLITFGAVVLCFASPLVAWLTSTIERRALLAATLLVFAIGHAASAMAPNYATLLAIRLLMLTVAAIYTPQAASTVALLVPAPQRPGAIAFVFLGWSLSVAGGLPLIAFLADHFGWRVSYAVIAGGALAASAFLVTALPAGLRIAPVSLTTWAGVGRNRLILLLLLLTAVQTSGQFAIFTFLAPLAARLGGASTTMIGALFATFGVTGFIGNVAATRIVTRIGAFNTSAVSLASVLLGLILWAFGAGSLPVMAAGVGFWGLGFAAVNSMQQARLVTAAPHLAAASVALNTSTIYVGQAVGSAIGGFLFARALYLPIGYFGVAFLVAALALLAMTRQPAATD